MPFRMLAIGVMALGLGALDAPTAVAQGASAFDGTWSGTGTLTAQRGRGTSCGPETTDRRFTVQNGQISFPYDMRRGISFSGPIAADGSFAVVSGMNRFQGRATGSTMTATFIGTECERSFQFRRRADR